MPGAARLSLCAQKRCWAPARQYNPPVRTSAATLVFIALLARAQPPSFSTIPPADAHTSRGHDQLLRKTGFPDLREIQRFHDKAKLTPHLQVLTFCSDYDYTHAPEYLKQAGYDFPVVADWNLIDR